MARKKKQVRNELEELDEAYVHLAGHSSKKRGCSAFFSIVLILLLLGGILLLIYLIKSGALIAG